MIVAVVRRPSACAASITWSHWSVAILSGQMTARTSSSRISAAVPGSEPNPASCSAARKSGTARPSVAAPCQISSGEKAWMWIAGSASPMARQIAR